MPKKFSLTEKSKWLEQYESGKSEFSIASEMRCDVRTARKGIEEARRDRDARTARVELFKRALLKHQESLLKKLDEIFSSLELPSLDWAPLGWDKDFESVLRERHPNVARVLQLEDNETKNLKASHVDVDMAEDMLRQHLRGEKLWKLLARRQGVYASHEEARIALQCEVARILEEETGYQLRAREQGTPPFLYSYTVGGLFFGLILRQAFGEDVSDAWRDEIVADSGEKCVKYRGMILARAPRAESKCRKHLLNAFDKMEMLPEVARVVETYEELQELNIKAKQAIEEIRALGLVPGVCNVCRRLGMY